MWHIFWSDFWVSDSFLSLTAAVLEVKGADFLNIFSPLGSLYRPTIWDNNKMIIVVPMQPFSIEYHDLLHPRWEISSTEGVINLVLHKLKDTIIILFYTCLNQPGFLSTTPASNFLPTCLWFKQVWNTRKIMHGWPQDRYRIIIRYCLSMLTVWSSCYVTNHYCDNEGNTFGINTSVNITVVPMKNPEQLTAVDMFTYLLSVKDDMNMTASTMLLM